MLRKVFENNMHGDNTCCVMCYMFMIVSVTVTHFQGHGVGGGGGDTFFSFRM